ncbi:hypothetical protein RUM43_013949 [Polyplax serrata]|uniref:Uncharacterized protein n=1 Tax=Polyplax serrata TaxID=468196 RepID=A0AAN8PBE7_POLSC
MVCFWLIDIGWDQQEADDKLFCLAKTVKIFVVQQRNVLTDPLRFPLIPQMAPTVKVSHDPLGNHTLCQF